MLYSDHPCADDLPAFALGALGEEMRSVGEHLVICGRCRAAVQSYSAVASLLVLTAPLSKPPPTLRQRILACIADTTLSDGE